MVWQDPLCESIPFFCKCLPDSNSVPGTEVGLGVHQWTDRANLMEGTREEQRHAVGGEERSGPCLPGSVWAEIRGRHGNESGDWGASIPAWTHLDSWRKIPARLWSAQGRGPRNRPFLLCCFPSSPSFPAGLFHPLPPFFYSYTAQTVANLGYRLLSLSWLTELEEILRRKGRLELPLCVLPAVCRRAWLRAGFLIFETKW